MVWRARAEGGVMSCTVGRFPQQQRVVSDKLSSPRCGGIDTPSRLADSRARSASEYRATRWGATWTWAPHEDAVIAFCTDVARSQMWLFL